MANDQGNNQQTATNPTYDPMIDRVTGNDLAKSLRVIANAMQQNPDMFNLGRRAPTESQSNYTTNKWKTGEGKHSVPKYRSSGNILDDFENGIKEQLLDSLAGGNFKKGMQSALDTFAKEFGMDIRDLPTEMGKKFTKQALKAFGNSETGQKLKAEAKKLGNTTLDFVFKNQGAQGDAVKQSLKNVLGSFRSGGGQGGLKLPAGGQGDVSNFFTDLAGKFGGKFGNVISKGAGMLGKAGSAIANSGAGKAIGGLATKAMGGIATKVVGAGASAGPWGLIIAAVAVVAAKVLKKIFGPLFQSIGEMAKALGRTFNKEEELRKKRLENAQQRLKDDVNWIIEKPFKILQEAAEKWADTWDANLAKIGQTQGYDKESVYALYESYAERLREDNLGNIINATDIVEKLSSVLDSGLTGKAAEEFAYVATKLNAAIPTQDFFGYVDTYASIAANAISQGKSQSQALALANKQLEDFASNLLYSSRELAGGFSTGLKNSSDLFSNAVKIAQSAKTNNATDISGTLTSVSAIIGAVAPDLASSLVDNVVQAAIGGNNNSALVALRSLAGVNAGNTEFLQAMAQDPKKVFSTLFSNLANMQNMSPANYMEVAEGLSDVFGIDKAAFARVDFNYLAKAINAMNTNSDTLEENLALLESGQTRTSAEQLKAQQINSIILEEGLAYVIDSEAGRMVQEHMWQEQLANEMANTEYAVSLQGSALSFLEGIRKTITNILNFLNPIGFLTKGISNMVSTIAESAGNEQDIKEILKLGAVGSNQKAFSNLTTRGKDLGLTTSLVEMMGGKQGIGILNSYANGLKFNSFMLGGADTFNTLYDKGAAFTPIGLVAKSVKDVTGAVTDLINHNKGITSRYEWGSVGKSFAQVLQSTPINSKSLLGAVISTAKSATELALESSNKSFQAFLDSAKEASKSMSFENWVASAKEKGISDFSEALKNYGKTEEEVRAYFEANQAQEGAKQETARKEDEQRFRDESREFWGFTSSGSGIFNTSLWTPFFGEGEKYDTRMNSVDTALSSIQSRIGSKEKHTVIGGIEEISSKIGAAGDLTVLGILSQMHLDLSNTFVSKSSVFQKCLADWTRYITASAEYTETVSRSSAWTDLKSAEKDQQTEATLALANALDVFSAEELKKLDPQLQTNVLLGEILVVVQSIMQQNNTTAGGLSLPDTLSALGFGMTFKTT